MKNTESNCHAFWKTNRNPITMQKCENETKLHLSQKSQVDKILTEKYSARKMRFDYENQILTKND